MTIELIHAASRGDVATINALLNPYTASNQLLIAANRYPNVNFQEKIYGSTPLHLALQGKHFDAAVTLINYGASSGVTNFRGLTALEAYNDFYFSNAIEYDFQQQQLGYMELSGDNGYAPFNAYDDNYYYL